MLSVSFINQAQRLPEMERAHLDSAEISYSSGDYKGCITHCNVVVKHIRHRRGYQLRAMAWAQLGNYQNAMSGFERASKTGGHNPMIYYQMSAIQNKLKNLDEAEKHLVMALNSYYGLTKRSDFYPFYLALGNCQRYKGAFDIAEVNLKKALRLGSTEAWIHLQSFFIQTNQKEKLIRFADSIGETIQLQYDKNSVYGRYARLLEHVAYDSILESDLKQVDELLYAVKPKEGYFSGIEQDILYLKYQLLLLNSADKWAYKSLKQFCENNPNHTYAQQELNVIKKKLGVDADAPIIEVLNPSLNSKKQATVRSNSSNLTLYIRLSDQSDLKRISINEDPFYGRVENHGIIVTEVRLNPGENRFEIKAMDIEENTASFNFNIQFEQKYTNDNHSPIAINDSSKQIMSSENNHALIIVQNDYTDSNFNYSTTDLKTINQLKSTLEKDYHYLAKNIHTIKNGDKKIILDSIQMLSKSLNTNDNLLIVYTGLGQIAQSSKGQLIPSHATYNDMNSYISSSELYASFSQSLAGHILLVIDSRFGDSEIRKTKFNPIYSIDQHIQQSSRQILSSGSSQTTSNESIIEIMTSLLQSNTNDVLTSHDLYNQIQSSRSYGDDALFGEISNSGDTGGIYLFMRY